MASVNPVVAGLKWNKDKQLKRCCWFFFQMQARLRDLEQQLESAKSATASRASCHSKSSSAVSKTAPDMQDMQGDERRRNSKSQAMSDWVTGALCEANTVVSGGAQEPSWLGLGSWVSVQTKDCRSWQSVTDDLKYRYRLLQLDLV